MRGLESSLKALAAGIGTVAIVASAHAVTVNTITDAYLYDLSQDGSTVVGADLNGNTLSNDGRINDFPTGISAAKWAGASYSTQTAIGGLAGDTLSVATGTNADGSVVGGFSGTMASLLDAGANNVDDTSGFRYTSGGGVVQVADPTIDGGTAYSKVMDVADNADVMVGSATASTYLATDVQPVGWVNDQHRTPAIWDNAGTTHSNEIELNPSYVPFGYEPYPTRYQPFQAFAVSDDGDVVVGLDQNGPGYNAIKYTRSTGTIVQIPGTLGPRVWTSDVSADGKYVGGRAWGSKAAAVDSNSQAYRHTETAGTQYVGFLDQVFVNTGPGGGTPNGGFSDAKAVADDGFTMFGRAKQKAEFDLGFLIIEENIFSGFIWDEFNGMRNINDVLANEYGQSQFNLAGGSYITDVTDVEVDEVNGKMTIVANGVTNAGLDAVSLALTGNQVGFVIELDSSGLGGATTQRLFRSDYLGGDANGDDNVDVLDLSILATNFGGKGFITEGDYNGDGVIDVLDLSILATNFGSSFPSATPIPEPASLALLALGGLALIRRR